MGVFGKLLLSDLQLLGQVGHRREEGLVLIAKSKALSLAVPL